MERHGGMEKTMVNGNGNGPLSAIQRKKERKKEA
jgi:hypothetical protein